MNRRLRELVDAFNRVDIAVLVFLTAMAMLGVAVALVLLRPSTPGSRNGAGPVTQHHVFESPYQAQPFNRGQLMVSSSRARGRSSPRDVANEYLRLGYTWISVTDVNTVDPVDGYSIPGMVTLAGEEMEYPFGHFLVYGVDHDAFADTPAQVGAWVHSSAGIVFVSRPLVSPTLDANAIGAAPVEGIQLYDARLAREQPGLADASSLWDQLLSAGHHLTAIAGDDSLSLQGPDSTVGSTSVDVQVADLTAPLIADALKRGAFVDSTGVRVLGVAAADGTVSVVTADADEITFIGQGGRVLARTQGPRGDYHVKWDEVYVRAVATRKDGARAWTMPVWLVP